VGPDSRLLADQGSGKCPDTSKTDLPLRSVRGNSLLGKPLVVPVRLEKLTLRIHDFGKRNHLFRRLDHVMQQLLVW
jgi:hypothetical protein